MCGNVQFLKKAVYLDIPHYLLGLFSVTLVFGLIFLSDDPLLKA
jgi:uncharacterized membrane protein